MLQKCGDLFISNFKQDYSDNFLISFYSALSVQWTRKMERAVKVVQAPANYPILQTPQPFLMLPVSLVSKKKQQIENVRYTYSILINMFCGHLLLFITVSYSLLASKRCELDECRQPVRNSRWCVRSHTTSGDAFRYASTDARPWRSIFSTDIERGGGIQQRLYEHPLGCRQSSSQPRNTCSK